MLNRLLQKMVLLASWTMQFLTGQAEWVNSHVLMKL